jgi:hypothetical protein
MIERDTPGGRHLGPSIRIKGREQCTRSGGGIAQKHFFGKAKAISDLGKTENAEGGHEVSRNGLHSLRAVWKTSRLTLAKQSYFSLRSDLSAGHRRLRGDRRAPQTSKSALADDVLGEEKFAQSLTLEDLRDLFAD